MGQPVKRGPGRPPKNPNHPSYIPRPGKSKLQTNKSKTPIAGSKRSAPKKNQLKTKPSKAASRNSSESRETKVSSGTAQGSGNEPSSWKEKENISKAASAAGDKPSKGNTKSSKSVEGEDKSLIDVQALKSPLVDNAIYDFPSDDCESNKGSLNMNMPMGIWQEKKYWVPSNIDKAVIDSIVITDVDTGSSMVTVRECAIDKGFF